MNLYQIDEQILDCMDLETGEIIDIERFESLNIEKDTKIENVALWIKNLKADAEAYKAEEKAFKERRQSAENKVESLKKLLERALNGQKFKTAKCSVSFRKSESVQVAEGAKVPEQFLRYKEPEINKVDLKKALKEGAEIAGCTLVEGKSIQIK